MKRFAFIINPKSGRSSKKLLVSKFEKMSKKLNFEFNAFFTNKPGHAISLSKEISNLFDAVFAVGGDGTVNEIATGLLGSNTPLGIIPGGSGNGIARHLRISMNPSDALVELSVGEKAEIDVWNAGETPFFMLCGLGFDAHIANMISRKKSRGVQAYIRLVTKEFAGFKPERVEITWDGGQYTGAPFLINMANGSQFGNNMKIAPKASITDGFLDLGIIEKIPLHLVPEFVLRMRNGTLNNFKYYQTFRVKGVVVNSGYKGINIDGEYKEIGNTFSVKRLLKRLGVIVPKGKKTLI